MIHLLTQTMEALQSFSILELRGLGKELWRGIEAATHVDQEREAWDSRI